MKLLFTCLFLLLTLCSFAQPKAKPVNIKLSGRVISFEAVEKPYIYYALTGDKFTIRNRIKMDARQNYTFDLSKTKYKNATTGVLVFSLDSTYDMNHKFSCVHRINIGEINKYAASKNLSVIELNSALVMDWMCESSIMERAANENESWVVGKYKLEAKDTTMIIELKQDAYEYSDSTSFLTSGDLLNGGYGRWKFTDDEKGISVFTVYRFNKQFGTMLSNGITTIYKLGNEKGKIVLVHPKGRSFVRQYE